MPNKRTVCSLWTLLLVASMPALAQPDASEAEAARAAQAFAERMQAYTIQIRGRDQPGLVPYNYKMRSFFQHFSRELMESRLQLTAQDYDTIADFLSEEERHEEAASAEVAELFGSICREISSQAPHEVDGVVLATRMAELEQRQGNGEAARYLALMNRLSPEGRRSIEQYVEAEVARGISMSTLDSVGLATEFPEFVAQNFIRRCSDERPPMPIIVSAGHSRSSGGVALANASSSIDATRSSDGVGRRALVVFTRIVPPDELLELLRSSNLALESVHYRDVGPGSGDITFAPDADLEAAIEAADSYVRYRKRAEAYAAQVGVSAVTVPEAGLLGPLLVRLDGPLQDMTGRNALRVTREELDAIPLPDCVADYRIEQPFANDGPDRAMLEAACGFRPYAVTVRGDRRDIDALADESELVSRVSFDP